MFISNKHPNLSVSTPTFTSTNYTFAANSPTQICSVPTAYYYDKILSASSSSAAISWGVRWDRDTKAALLVLLATNPCRDSLSLSKTYKRHILEKLCLVHDEVFNSVFHGKVMQLVKYVWSVARKGGMVTCERVAWGERCVWDEGMIRRVFLGCDGACCVKNAWVWVTGLKAKTGVVPSPFSSSALTSSCDESGEKGHRDENYGNGSMGDTAKATNENIISNASAYSSRPRRCSHSCSLSRCSSPFVSTSIYSTLSPEHDTEEDQHEYGIQAAIQVSPSASVLASSPTSANLTISGTFHISHFLPCRSMSCSSSSICSSSLDEAKERGSGVSTTTSMKEENVAFEAEQWRPSISRQEVESALPPSPILFPGTNSELDNRSNEALANSIVQVQVQATNTNEVYHGSRESNISPPGRYHNQPHNRQSHTPPIVRPAAAPIQAQPRTRGLADSRHAS
ncbi:hypothetical protein F5Y12DRAFT_721591 [Xylaria sp. FL1777]|nr:hypothetical protein F5Y12DRAFT_721591 [Xylaria sp. FL1777]